MSDDEVPPPYSEQELDRKIARALVISVQQHQASPTQQDLTDDGEWEQWDEAVFAAAQARRNRTAIDPSHIGSSTSQTYERRESLNASPLPVPGAVQPLRLHKRGHSSVGGASASWMGDVVGEERYGSGSSGHRVHHDIPPDSDDDDRSIPPPPFTSMGSRMDGLFRLEYHPGSTPPSPLNSPPPDHLLPPNAHLALNGQNHFPANPHLDTVRLSPQPGTIQRSPQQVLPMSARSPNYYPQQRPASVSHLHQNSATSHLILNQSTHPSRAPDWPGQRMTSTHPLMQTQSPHDAYLSAYKKSAQTLPSQSQSFTASALYHSSVSGHLSTPMSMQPRESHSSRQHRSAQTPQSPPLQHNTLHIPDHASSSAALPLGATSTNYLANQSTPNIHAQGSLPSQPTNATYFPQHPTYPTQYGDPTVPRWATSEQQLNQNFQQ